MVKKTRRLPLAICIILAAATLAVYAQVRLHDFVDFDDMEYIVANPHVNTGISWKNIAWAFTSAHSNNWHPLTWISHMIDVEFFGLDPAGHHLMNVFFHVVNAVLLFLLFVRMTGRIWPSAFVAGLFALHPLHVESVAWAAERKDVLSACLGILTLWSYVRYTEKPGVNRYLAVLFFFSAGLMAKQMLVTLPFVMLLLDYWPLRRLFPDQIAGTTEHESNASLRQAFIAPQRNSRKPSRRRAPLSMAGKAAKTIAASSSGYPKSWWMLVVEKLPFFLLSGLASVTVFLVQLKSGVLFDLNPFPLQARMENAIVSYVAYMGKMIWPFQLAVFYPHPLQSLMFWQVFAAAAFLAAITVLCWRYRKHRYGIMGWFWYLGMLVPVIGLVQVGVQAMADRYTYLPLIGLFIMAAWGVPDLWGRRPYRKPILAGSAVLVLLLCAALTWVQTGVWKDRETLYSHAANVIPNNYWAYNNLGAAVFEQGRQEESRIYFAKSLSAMPFYPGANKNMAVLLYKQERCAEALPYINKALKAQPNNPEYRIIQGLCMMKLGRMPEAIRIFRDVLEKNPANRDAREALAEAEQRLRTNH